MLKMSQVNYIRDLHNSGCRISEITRETGIDPKTIRKYISKDDFSEKPPIKTTHQSILDEHKHSIDAWLEEDKKSWYKQKHTAKRFYDRLVDECGYTGSYSVVQRYVKKMREHILPKASLELIWAPGTAQVDFGDADFIVKGEKTRLKYLVVSFPYSNNSFCQVFGGENAECVCQGLQDIFNYIGGVPPLLIFDNATGIGRRIGGVVHENKVFTGFKAQYGDVRTDTCDYSTSLAVLLKNVGAWHNSGVRADTTDVLKEYMDNLPKEKLKDCLRIMRDLREKFGYNVAVEAMEKTCRNGNINICDTSVLADRILGYGLDTPPTAGPTLESYDALLLGGNALC